MIVAVTLSDPGTNLFIVIHSKLPAKGGPKLCMKSLFILLRKMTKITMFESKINNTMILMLLMHFAPLRKYPSKQDVHFLGESIQVAQNDGGWQSSHIPVDKSFTLSRKYPSMHAVQKVGEVQVEQLPLHLKQLSFFK